MAKIDEIMKKVKNNEALTTEESNYLFKKLNMIYGNASYKDEIIVSYPMNLFMAIAGERDLIYATPEDEEKLAQRIEYVLKRYLKEDEASVLRLRFDKRMSLDEVGSLYGKTREWVRQREAIGLRKLRHPARYSLLFADNDLFEMNKQKQDRLIEVNKQLDKKINDTVYKIKMLDQALKSIDAPTNVTVEMKKDDRNLYLFNLSVRTYNCLKRSGVLTVGDLVSKKKSEVMMIRNISRKCVDELTEFLHNMDLDWIPEEG